MAHLTYTFTGSNGKDYTMRAHSQQVNDLLGLGPKGKLPVDGLPPVYIQGIRVWVNPVALARERKQFHRVRCACPTCNAEVPLGRLAQHKCKG